MNVLVLHVIRDLFSHGGTPRKLLGLVRASVDSDVEHAFLVFDDTSETLVDQFRAAGASVVVYSRRSALDPRLVGDVVHSVRSLKADVIATHFARADVMGAIAGRRLEVPVVKHVHGIIVNQRSLVRFADRLVAPYRAAVVCNSEATMAAEIKRNGARNVQVVLNGVDEMSPPCEGAREQVREEMGISSEEYVVGHVGGLIPSRDQHLLIQAVARLRTHGVPARCLIVGDGPEAARLEAVAEDVGV
ncbi:MAG: glycosyltransferase, partial [Coriobacteriia bacterium]